MNTLHRTQLLQKINEKKGQFFSLTFIKKDGTLREMNCRLGVSKGVKGVGHKFDPAARGLLSVYDAQIGEYRFINLNTVKTLKLAKNSYLVID